MKKLTKTFYKIYINITNSIAFLPILIAAGLFILSILVLYFDTVPLSTQIKKNFPYLFVSGYENARQILRTLISGIITLTVFSFSMVMIVLNQASSNFSPRVIPGVITKKAHQVILGFCVGTIVYSLIILHNIKSTQLAFQFPQIGVFIGEVLGVICLILFVYFIHSISQSIQVDNILVKVLNDTLVSLKKEKQDNNDHKKSEYNKPDSDGWCVLKSVESGYYRNFEISTLLGTASRENLMIEISVPKGSFVVKDSPFLKISKEVSEDVKKIILEAFIFYQEEYIKESYLYGFKQTSEVAVKALSAALNDPGTAIRSINHLTLMFSEMLNKKTDDDYFDSEGYLRIIQKNNSLDELIYNYLTPIREYGKKDVNIILKLLKCFEDLLTLEHGKDRYISVFHKHINIIREDADNSIFNQMDRKKINSFLESLNSYFEKKDHFAKI